MAGARRVALVTGAAQRTGIGAAIAARLAADGCDVMLADRDGAAVAERAAELADGHGVRVRARPVDVTDTASVDELLAACEAELGTAEIVVPNAGVGTVRPLLDSDDALWTTTFDVNVQGAARTITAAARRLIAQERPGRFVLVASGLGKTARPGLAVYSASKAAVLSLTQAAAAEWAPHGIRVNAVCPGQVDTALLDGLNRASAALAGIDPETFRREHAVARIPVGRFGRPGEIADAVAYLAGDRASYVTGTTLNVAGGSEVH